MKLLPSEMVFIIHTFETQAGKSELVSMYKGIKKRIYSEAAHLLIERTHVGPI